MNRRAIFRFSQLRQHGSQADVVAIIPGQLTGTHWPFIALCGFVLSQAYTIPILPLGPWPLWPRLSDFAVILLAGTSFLQRRHLWKPSTANRGIRGRLIIFYWLCLVSYLVYLLFNHDPNAVGVVTGAFQLYMLTLFTVVFFATSLIPLNEERVTVLRRITDIALTTVIISVVVTAFEIVPLANIAPHLPRDPDVAGPWHRYGLTLAEYGDNRGGWGTIGYNHAYVSTQILLLCGLRISLASKRDTLANPMFLLCGVIAAFLTQGRAGFFAMIVFALIYSVKKPGYILAATGIASVVITILVIVLAGSQKNYEFSNLSATADRATTLSDPANPENLSGRAEIWNQRILFLDAEPIRWIIGIGFGAARESGDNAHNLLLHLTLEMGLLGVGAFTILYAYILWALFNRSLDDRTLFWATLALFISCFSQETFYPVPAMGYFPGFYFCVVALALRNPSTSFSCKSRFTTDFPQGSA